MYKQIDLVVRLFLFRTRARNDFVLGRPLSETGRLGVRHLRPRAAVRLPPEPRLALPPSRGPCTAGARSESQPLRGPALQVTSWPCLGGDCEHPRTRLPPRREARNGRL